ncbi:hypothetical protein [Paracoccus sp. Z118]|uniref:hypothetical protein n=1 Tax=Paracoccus sp. Z118 TaxID=2851017 RepID=UPI001C2C4260|nr:hypothetical protein [Paracoccus sp. Z118]
MATGAKRNNRNADGTTSPVSLALVDLPLQHREQLLQLVRAVARDAARMDHAADARSPAD